MKRSGKKPIRQISHIPLKELGIDPEITDLRTEGIPIPKFNEFIQKVYDMGYKDGLEQYGNARDELKAMTHEGRAISRFKRLAKEITETSVTNKQTGY